MHRRHFGVRLARHLWVVVGIVAICLSAPPSALAHADLLALIDLVTKQIEGDPKNAVLYLRRGELYRAHTDWKLAEGDYDRVAQLDPKLGAVDFCRGRLCFEAGENDRARILLNKFLTDQPDHVEALLTRARLLVKLGEHGAAAADFTQAITHTAEPMPEYYLERAQAQTGEGEIETALRGMDEGLKRFGPLVGMQLYAIELECARKHYDAALSRLETISTRAERKERWLVKRGEILTLAGRRDEAKKSFNAALAAIEALPLRLRQSPAMMELKTRVDAALGAGIAGPKSGASSKNK